MGMRVRKLARELRGSSGEVLGLLHELGLSRYRSPEDMLSAAVVDRVRTAWSKGQRGEPVRVARPRPKPKPKPKPKPEPAPDLMAQLVPGVVPAGKRRSVARDVDTPIEALAEPGPDTAALDEMRKGLDEERRAVDAAKKALADARRAMKREQEALAEARAAMEAREQALEEAESAESEPEPVDPDSLIAVLQARGLRGADEFERALAVLAEQRQARELLPLLAVTDPEAARHVLDQALMLVGGEVPEELPPGVAGVRVAPERAELPGWEDLRRMLDRVAEKLMLHGLRHVVVVGGRPAWQRLARAGIDPRVELRFQPAGVLAREGDDRVDAVILWGAIDEDKVGWSDRVQLIEVDGDDLSALSRAVRAALEG